VDSPIYDFLLSYKNKEMCRFHMPGHKGRGFLGCEQLDITEVQGADALYEASGIIGRSEANAAELFGTSRTCYSTEGSSQCIRAMLHLALSHRPSGAAPVIVAARNVHRSFVYAAALLDAEVVWLWPKENHSLCSCPVTPEQLEHTLSALAAPPAAVYITSPDYLGGMADIPALAQICRRYHTLLAVDNAHGAYLHFLENSLHPMDLGADICCDSAHKTLPVLTGGAYLHIAKGAEADILASAKEAMALFGSTSPSYLIMASLDHCNAQLAQGLAEDIRRSAQKLEKAKALLCQRGWQVEKSDPFRITVTAPEGMGGAKLACRLRKAGIEPEYDDPDQVVLMASAQNTAQDIDRMLTAFGINELPSAKRQSLPVARGERIMSIRQAVFAPHETVSCCDALGRICAAPAVSCPPAIPIAVSGERIGEAALELFRYYGIKQAEVVKE